MLGFRWGSLSTLCEFGSLRSCPQSAISLSPFWLNIGSFGPGDWGGPLCLFMSKFKIHSSWEILLYCSTWLLHEEFYMCRRLNMSFSIPERCWLTLSSSGLTNHLSLSTVSVISTYKEEKRLCCVISHSGDPDLGHTILILFSPQIPHGPPWFSPGPSGPGEFVTEKKYVIQKIWIISMYMYVKVSRALSIGAVPFSPATKTSDIRKRCDTTIVDHRH